MQMGEGTYWFSWEALGAWRARGSGDALQRQAKVTDCSSSVAFSTLPVPVASVNPSQLMRVLPRLSAG